MTTDLETACASPINARAVSLDPATKLGDNGHMRTIAAAASRLVATPTETMPGLVASLGGDRRRWTPELATDPIGRADRTGGRDIVTKLARAVGYPGGKSGAGVYQRIINQIPPHDLYLEPFLGGGSVMFYKRPSLRDVGVDMNGDTITAARKFLTHAELITGDGLDYLRGLLATQDYARVSTFSAALKQPMDPVAKVGGPLVVPAAATGGDSSRIVVYADPPYLMSTRRGSSTRLYKVEATDQTHDGNDEPWHTGLLDILDALECNVLLSGYLSDLYQDRLKAPKWRTVTYTGMTHAGPATEYLWLNYPEPIELHDYRYLGENRRQRERIKKKKKRWTAKLEKMPALERYAILAAIAEAQTSTAAVVGDTSSTK